MTHRPEGSERPEQIHPAEDAEQATPAAQPEQVPQPASFNAQYRVLVKDVFVRIVGESLANGEDPDERARSYASRGKPDFTLAYLVAGALPEAEKRELLAASYERRAANTEQKAREFDRRFHRPFPLLYSEATKDRTTAKQIRAGRRIRPGAGKHLPTLLGN